MYNRPLSLKYKTNSSEMVGTFAGILSEYLVILLIEVVNSKLFVQLVLLDGASHVNHAATTEKCLQCGKCDRACLMGISPMKDITKFGQVKDPNCINCLECVSNCPKNAIEFAAK